MSRVTTLRTVVATIAVLSFIAVGASPTRASAATCAGASCTGLDPYASHCGDDRNVAGSADITDDQGHRAGKLTLYFSHACGANWGEASFDDGNPASTPPVTVRAAGSQSGSSYDTPPVDYTTTAPGSPVWGNMVASPGCAYTAVTRGSLHGQAVEIGCPPPSPFVSSGTSCSGQDCTGQDPYATGCAAGATIAGSGPLSDGAGSVTLYWSPACHTNWAAASFADGNPPTTPPVRVRVVGSGGSTSYDNAPVDYDTTGSGSPIWGNMTYSPGCAYGEVSRGGVSGRAVEGGCPSPAGYQVSTPFTLTTGGTALQVTGGDAVSGPIAYFQDPDTSAVPSDFLVFIDWGDGSLDQGTVVGSPDEFAVLGDHVYDDPTEAGVATAKGYDVTVTIYDDAGGPDGGGGTATAYSSVEVVGRDVPVDQPDDGSEPAESTGDKAWSIAANGFGLLGAGAGCVAGVIGEVPTGFLDTFATLFACGETGAQAVHTGEAIADPPDKHFKHVFHAPTRHVPHLPKHCKHLGHKQCGKLRKLALRYVRARIRASVLLEEVGVTANRFGGAAKARDRASERLQRKAERRYFKLLRKATKARRAAGRVLGRFIQQHRLDRRLSARQIGAGRLRLLSLRGLSHKELKRLRREGSTARRAKIRALIRRGLAWAPPPRNTTLSAALTK